MVSCTRSLLLLAIVSIASGKKPFSSVKANGIHGIWSRLSSWKNFANFACEVILNHLSGWQKTGWTLCCVRKTLKHWRTAVIYMDILLLFGWLWIHNKARRFLDFLNIPRVLNTCFAHNYCRVIEMFNPSFPYTITWAGRRQFERARNDDERSLQQANERIGANG